MACDLGSIEVEELDEFVGPLNVDCGPGVVLTEVECNSKHASSASGIEHLSRSAWRDGQLRVSLCQKR